MLKKSEWISNFFSIFFFSFFAIASWGLNQVLQQFQRDQRSPNYSEPGTVIYKARVVQTNAGGQPQYQIQANRISHDEQSARGFIEEPVIISLGHQKPKTEIRASQAVTSEQQNKVFLSGNVRIYRSQFENTPSLLIQTEQATLFIKEEIATSDAPVIVSRGTSTLQGIGMRFDQNAQRLEIVSDSRMVVPKKGQQ